MKYIAFIKNYGDTLARRFDSFKEAEDWVLKWFGQDFIGLIESYLEEPKDTSVFTELFSNYFTEVDLYRKENSSFYFRTKDGEIELEIVPESTES